MPRLRGATLVTHLFNGMGPFGHRAPGLPGAALDDDRLTPSLIADFVHVHPAALRLAALRKDCILVTDAVAVGVEYFGQAVTDRDGAAYLEDGTLTGSTLTMDRAVTERTNARRPPARRRHGDEDAGACRGYRQLRGARHRRSGGSCCP